MRRLDHDKNTWEGVTIVSEMTAMSDGVVLVRPFSRVPYINDYQ
jgi:hypothetical protein